MSVTVPRRHQFPAHSLPFISVTVFNDRAEVKRTLQVLLKEGINEVIVENVSQFADESSVRVDGRGGATIHEVQFQQKASLPEELHSPRLQELESQVKVLKLERQKVEDRQKVLETEVDVFDQIVKEVGRSYYKSLKVVRRKSSYAEAVSEEAQQAGGSVAKNPGGETQSFQVDDETLKNLTQFFDFYAESSIEKRGKLRECTEELKSVDEKIRKLRAEIDGARNNSRFAKNISVLLECSEDVSVDLDISYQVWCASWHPSYDIRVNTGDNDQTTMQITYFGKIVQQTGEDWIDAPIVLSTARPAVGGRVPELGTLNAVFYKPLPPPQPRPVRMMASRKLAKRDVARNAAYDRAEAEEDEEEVMAMESMPCFAAAPVAAVDTALSTTFNIPRPATITSGSGEHKVTITILDLEPVMVHETVPSKDTNVYVSASALNASLFPLLAGEASVYLGSSFITKTSLKAVSPGERFLCSLGVDPAISVEYKPAHRFSEQVGVISKSTSMAHEQKILIKNTKQKRVLITVKECIPKSTDEKIKIRLFAPELSSKLGSETETLKAGALPTAGARLDKSHNLEWTLNAEPNRKTELLVKWVVDYPTSETIEFV